jgi:hypothetical protein
MIYFLLPFEPITQNYELSDLVHIFINNEFNVSGLFFTSKEGWFYNFNNDFLDFFERTKSYTTPIEIRCTFEKDIVIENNMHYTLSLTLNYRFEDKLLVLMAGGEKIKIRGKYISSLSYKIINELLSMTTRIAQYIQTEQVFFPIKIEHIIDHHTIPDTTKWPTIAILNDQTIINIIAELFLFNFPQKERTRFLSF